MVQGVVPNEWREANITALFKKGSKSASQNYRPVSLTNLLKFFEKVTDEIDKGKPFDCIYLDFAKAFDKVPHFRLIKKLKAHGVDEMWQNGFFLG